ncbi:MAG: prepilin-type N-terminal cleavage/methylation domain-containing protein [Planctomycetota bacterium]
MVKSENNRAFTLTELLTVAVILGIVAAIAVPKFTSASDEATTNATLSELAKSRRAIDMYLYKNGQQPDITAGAAPGAWGSLIGEDYLRVPPVNSHVDSAVASTVSTAGSADTAYQSTHGWVYDPATGKLWAGSFDADDKPIPAP